MDDLKDKQTKDYHYLSRYSSFPFYYNEKDRKYIYGITSHLNTEIPYVAHKVKQGDTLDTLSEYYYGRPDLYWVIADFNRIPDPFMPLWRNIKVIKVPSLGNITFKQ